MVDTGAEALKQLDEDSLDYTAKELEARLIAGRIRQLVSQGQGILVWDKSRELTAGPVTATWLSCSEA